ncbi:helix-turn-helix transcriptional regulator [Sinomicrobium soli]|uniref:helix-turn-helix transcriptional regulator n=1 Tax=Sinomicrobium sp. N-1-3-6 TaxID=2219864 RepID=UPI000DCDAFD2|nr:AraC family transcriptional regulator [Sinomicrobium sp. N-1-3-6]RAV27733.1 AraC family transcriptional regulator [Sinomicrobium sp. N-1-3-6]
MAFRIHSSDFSDFIAAGPDGLTATDKNASSIRLQTPKGDIRYRELLPVRYVSILQGSYHMEEDVIISGEGTTALLEIQLNLSGTGIAYRDKLKKIHTAPAMTGNIAYLSADENQAEIFFNRNTAYQTFDIHLPLSFLEKYAGISPKLDGFIRDIFRGHSSKLSENPIGINPGIYNAVQDIKNCTFDGLTRKIFLEAKVYELLALLYESAESKKTGVKLHASDLERIHHAAFLIRENLECPLTIIALSRTVGMNQTKLKHLFKQVFGKTLFGYLQEIRMHQARKYLLGTSLTIQEVSLKVGYQNASNFSIAFKNVYGYSPGQLRP